MGLPTAITYLITLFLFMPFPFIDWFQGANLAYGENASLDTFPYNKV
jgi:UDP-N-acetylglucosamine--dolichyl-phosphate N-acetylglucosaminephosphotransferase